MTPEERAALADLLDRVATTARNSAHLTRCSESHDVVDVIEDVNAVLALLGRTRPITSKARRRERKQQ